MVEKTTTSRNCTLGDQSVYPSTQQDESDYDEGDVQSFEESTEDDDDDLNDDDEVDRMCR